MKNTVNLNVNGVIESGIVETVATDVNGVKLIIVENNGKYSYQKWGKNGSSIISAKLFDTTEEAVNASKYISHEKLAKLV
jgi:hypothetical protein